MPSGFTITFFVTWIFPTKNRASSIGLALSALFRRVSQYDKAEGILLRLHADSPRHPEVNLQLAILYNIIGDPGKAAKHRDLAKTAEQKSDHIRLSILEQVASHLQGMAPSAKGRSKHYSDAMPLPEDVGLAKCERVRVHR